MYQFQNKSTFAPSKLYLMERRLMTQLLSWKESKDRKPLILEGARQVGKTWLLNLFFWTSEKNSEVDFVMQYETDIVPIEVKSGTNVKAKSLKQFREKYLPKISVRFSLKETKLDDNLLNISLYHSHIFDFLLEYSCRKCVK